MEGSNFETLFQNFLVISEKYKAFNLFTSLYIYIYLNIDKPLSEGLTYMPKFYINTYYTPKMNYQSNNSKQYSIRLKIDT